MLVAEIGNNHEGSFERAKRLIDLAAPHCDAVKFQIFEAAKLVHPSLPSRVPGHRTQIDRMRSLQFDDDQWLALKAHAESRGVEFMATCFDLETLARWIPRLSRLKIASGDITYLPMIDLAAASGKPVIVSTGGATEAEIREVVRRIPSATLLHCVSIYPCLRPNLGWIARLKALHTGPVGYSCHTPGIEACAAAALLGAVVIEKHFTDERGPSGDHQHAATPQELAELSRRLFDIPKLMGEHKEMPDFGLRRGPYAACPVRAGETFTDTNTIWLRPAHGGRIPTTAARDYAPMEAIDG